MPHDPVAVEIARKWLRYARSDYQLAQMGPVQGVLQDDDDITEADYRQAIEQAKAVLDWAGRMIGQDLGESQTD